MCADIFLHEDSTVKIGDFGLATVKTGWSGTESKKTTNWINSVDGMYVYVYQFWIPKRAI